MQMNKNDILVWMRGFKNFNTGIAGVILELIYPNTCVICGKICDEGICFKCKKLYPFIQEPRCMCCGKPIISEDEEYCSDCAQNKKMFQQGRSLWVHKDDIKQSVYRFKYKNHRIYAKEYARLLVREHVDVLGEWRPDCIIPVPIHGKRRRSRGYNQAEVLAVEIQEEILRQLDILIPINTAYIYRKKETVYQKQLDNHERKKNLKSAFEINKSTKLPKNILIIDDIYTTGATIQAISELLAKAGCDRSVFFTISIGQGF